MCYLSDNLKNNSYENFLKSLKIIKTFKSPIPRSIPNLLADGFATIEKSNLKANEIIMNSITFADLRILGKGFFESETIPEKIKKGILGHLWGADIFVIKKIPDHITLILSEPKYAIILKTIEIPYHTKELVNHIEEIKKYIADISKRTNDINKALYEMTRTEE